MTNHFTRRAISKGNRLARELRSTQAVTGKTASQFWCLLSCTALPVSISKKLYLKAGYKPFAGYPLVRK